MPYILLPCTVGGSRVDRAQKVVVVRQLFCLLLL